MMARMDGCIEGWEGRARDGWMDGWMEGWMDDGRKEQDGDELTQRRLLGWSPRTSPLKRCYR